ncbi:hypothetical protein K7X08_036373 [Anisodus acutangulus]|uniref:C3H1-type domain-containing protein n=1 Tax=Anisodus acutangulus TaxID=402998 RepID=A0A9Q1L551_9SOLA|nr:hypothetical protein K7X08_036373 [Anisodus acutangulus]
MENSHIGALKPLQNPYPFPPFRRRLLMSETYNTLLQIISNFPSTVSTIDKQKLDVIEDDNGSSKLGKENEVGVLVDHHLIRSENLLVNGPAHKVSDNLLGNEGSSRYRYEDFSGAPMEVDLDLSNRKIEGGRGDSITNAIIDMDCLIDKSQMVEESGNRCSTHESEEKEPDRIGQSELVKELSIDDVGAAIESCFGEDAIADLSQPAELSGEKTETHLSEEMKHGLRVKEMELETLISSAGATDSSVHVPEIEEDEVPGDLMVFDESDYDILNHVGNEKKDESPFGLEEFAFDVHVNEPQKRDTYASSSIDAVDEDTFIRKFREEQEDITEKVFRETRKVCVYDGILDSGNVAKQVGGDMKLNHPAGSQFEDKNIGKNKTKRGPGKGAKRKAKKRIQRAEKNRELGVKRLKFLPPVVKPKVVTYCRHYLNGRCSEGDNCKFSHDTTPLTKSKPCFHFARQSCMKGDDCPFDHQLSKYPCNNYSSKGFCSRGAGCLFSHEVAAKTSNLELLSPSAPSNSNSLIHGMSHEDVSSTYGSAQHVPGKSTVLEPAQKPKGVKFLSNGKPLQSAARKHEEAGLSSKADDAGKYSCQIIDSKSENIQKPKGASMRTPLGINFLSFGRAPLFDMDYGVKKLQLGDMNNIKEAATCSNSVKDDNQANISAKLGSMSQMLTRSSPGSVPRGVNFLSVGKEVEDRSHPNEFNRASSSIQRRHIAPDRTSSKMLLRELNSFVPAAQSLNQSAQKCNTEIASSSKGPFLANTPGSIQKALQSTLAFAAKFDLGVKYGVSNGSPDDSSAINHKGGSSKDK